MQNNPSLLWDEAHISYDDLTDENSSYTGRGIHGPLAKKNSFTDSLRQVDKVRLLHVTTSLDKILSSGELRASGGCLVGSLYCAPIDETPEGLRAHNLGAYIHSRETALNLKHKKIEQVNTSSLIIEADISPGQSPSCMGIDYLRLGAKHLEILHKLENLLSPAQRRKLKVKTVKNLKEAEDFWRICQAINHDPTIIDDETFFRVLRTTISSLLILGYLYFEVVTEYIILFSKDNHSMKCAQRGELNCWAYKEFVFGVQPHLLENFNLGNFRPSLQKLLLQTNLMHKEGTLNIDAKDFIASIKWRLSDLVASRLFRKCGLDQLTPIPKYSFDILVKTVPDLVGHSIDRTIRGSKEYNEFSYAYDNHKAQQIWDYWNKSNIIFPFNGILPKGEVGLNPTSTVNYRIYLGTEHASGKDLFLEKGKELPLKIVPKFLNPLNSFMGLRPKSK